MGKQIIGLVGASGALIALYLVLTNFLGAKVVLGSLFGGYVDAVKALQGR